MKHFYEIVLVTALLAACYAIFRPRTGLPHHTPQAAGLPPELTRGPPFQLDKSLFCYDQPTGKLYPAIEGRCPQAKR